MTASMKILKRGMDGNAVEIWQKILCIAGYSVKDAASKGSYIKISLQKNIFMTCVCVCVMIMYISFGGGLGNEFYKISFI